MQIAIVQDGYDVSVCVDSDTARADHEPDERYLMRGSILQHIPPREPSLRICHLDRQRYLNRRSFTIINPMNSLVLVDLPHSILFTL